MMLLSETCIVENSSIDTLLSHCLDEFLELFSSDEKTYCFAKKKWRMHLAARFAAKHAVFKLLEGSTDIRWDSIQIRQAESGAPYLDLTESAAAVAERLKLQHWQLSLTHTIGLAAALVAAEVQEATQVCYTSTSSLRTL